MRRLAEIGPTLSAAHAAEQRPARSRSIPAWQDLLDEEDGGGLPVDSTPAGRAREWAGGASTGDSPPALQLPADVQALMAERSGSKARSAPGGPRRAAA